MLPKISFLKHITATSRKSRNFSKKFNFNKLITSPVSQPSEKETYSADRFFEAIGEHKKIISKSSIPCFLFEEVALKKILRDIDPNTEGNYLMGCFSHWITRYVAHSTIPVQNYFSCRTGINLDPVCKDFIDFCFKNRISLDPEKTLESFSFHNQLSDLAVKKQLMTIKPKNQINILGFGLDEGHYEKTLADFLMNNGLANSVKIYGFDPYAVKTPDIEYLTSLQIDTKKEFSFDLITARWALHHVELEHRWGNFVKCVNNCNPNAMILVIEHGFLKKKHSPFDKKLYYFLNATFDIVANIGLRPQYLTKNSSSSESDFFIKYLELADFDAIKDSVTVHATQNIYEVGPHFPNQTIFCMQTV